MVGDAESSATRPVSSTPARKAAERATAKRNAETKNPAARQMANVLVEQRIQQLKKGEAGRGPLNWARRIGWFALRGVRTRQAERAIRNYQEKNNGRPPTEIDMAKIAAQNYAGEVTNPNSRSVVRLDKGAHEPILAENSEHKQAIIDNIVTPIATGELFNGVSATNGESEENQQAQRRSIVRDRLAKITNTDPTTIDDKAIDALIDTGTRIAAKAADEGQQITPDYIRATFHEIYVDAVLGERGNRARNALQARIDKIAETDPERAMKLQRLADIGGFSLINIRTGAFIASQLTGIGALPAGIAAVVVTAGRLLRNRQDIVQRQSVNTGRVNQGGAVAEAAARTAVGLGASVVGAQIIEHAPQIPQAIQDTIQNIRHTLGVDNHAAPRIGVEDTMQSRGAAGDHGAEAIRNAQQPSGATAESTIPQGGGTQPLENAQNFAPGGQSANEVLNNVTPAHPMENTLPTGGNGASEAVANNTPTDHATPLENTLPTGSGQHTENVLPTGGGHADAAQPLESPVTGHGGGPQALESPSGGDNTAVDPYYHPPTDLNQGNTPTGFAPDQVQGTAPTGFAPDQIQGGNIPTDTDPFYHPPTGNLYDSPIPNLAKFIEDHLPANDRSTLDSKLFFYDTEHGYFVNPLTSYTSMAFYGGVLDASMGILRIINNRTAKNQQFADRLKFVQTRFLRPAYLTALVGGALGRIAPALIRTPIPFNIINQIPLLNRVLPHLIPTAAENAIVPATYIALAIRNGTAIGGFIGGVVRTPGRVVGGIVRGVGGTIGAVRSRFGGNRANPPAPGAPGANPSGTPPAPGGRAQATAPVAVGGTAPGANRNRGNLFGRGGFLGTGLFGRNNNRQQQIAPRNTGRVTTPYTPPDADKVEAALSPRQNNSPFAGDRAGYVAQALGDRGYADMEQSNGNILPQRQARAALRDQMIYNGVSDDRINQAAAAGENAIRDASGTNYDNARINQILGRPDGTKVDQADIESAQAHAIAHELEVASVEGMLHQAGYNIRQLRSALNLPDTVTDNTQVAQHLVDTEGVRAVDVGRQLGYYDNAGNRSVGTNDTKPAVPTVDNFGSRMRVPRSEGIIRQAQNGGVDQDVFEATLRGLDPTLSPTDTPANLANALQNYDPAQLVEAFNKVDQLAATADGRVNGTIVDSKVKDAIQEIKVAGTVNEVVRAMPGTTTQQLAEKLGYPAATTPEALARELIAEGIKDAQQIHDAILGTAGTPLAAPATPEDAAKRLNRLRIDNALGLGGNANAQNRIAARLHGQGLIAANTYDAVLDYYADNIPSSEINTLRQQIQPSMNADQRIDKVNSFVTVTTPDQALQRGGIHAGTPEELALLREAYNRQLIPTDPGANRAQARADLEAELHALYPRAADTADSPARQASRQGLRSLIDGLRGKNNPQRANTVEKLLRPGQNALRNLPPQVATNLGINQVTYTNNLVQIYNAIIAAGGSGELNGLPDNPTPQEIETILNKYINNGTIQRAWIS